MAKNEKHNNEGDKMTERDVPTEIKNLKKGFYFLPYIIGGLFLGSIWAAMEETRPLKKEITELRTTMSNLVQRVNYYHGTNWTQTEKGFQVGEKR